MPGGHCPPINNEWRKTVFGFYGKPETMNEKPIMVGRAHPTQLFSVFCFYENTKNQKRKTKNPLGLTYG